VNHRAIAGGTTTTTDEAYWRSVDDGEARYRHALDQAAATPAFDALASRSVAIVGCSGLLGSTTRARISPVAEPSKPEQPTIATDRLANASKAGVAAA